MTFQITDQQAATIAARWNSLADAGHQIDAAQAHTVFHDNSDSEIAEQGYTTIEVGRFTSATGNPATFEVYDTDVETVT